MQTFFIFTKKKYPTKVMDNGFSRVLLILGLLWGLYKGLWIPVLINVSLISILTIYSSDFTVGFILISNIFPQQFLDKFKKLNLINILEYRRINLWKESISLISTKPLFGIGAAAFPILYQIYYQPEKYTEQHTHNLFLEISAGYGFIASSMIFLFIYI